MDKMIDDDPAPPLKVGADNEFLVHSATTLIEAFSRLVDQRTGPVPISQLGPNYQHLVKGRYELWQPNSQCIASIRDGQILEDHSTVTPMGECMGIEYILEGGYEQWYGQNRLQNTHNARITLSSHTEDGEQRKILQTGDTVKSVALWLAPDFLSEHYDLDIAKLPKQIQEINGLSKAATVTFPMSSTIRSIISDIIDNPFHGKIAERYLQAKFTELFCHTALNIANLDDSYLQDNNLARRKSTALATVTRHINNNYCEPLSVEQLAELVSMCKSNLSVMFKQSYGLSITEYLLKIRMEKALELIHQGKQTMMEISQAVGYNAQSSFARAYKKYYGRSPKEDRLD